MRDGEAGRSNLNLSEVDDSLGKALGHSNELEKRAQHLQVHFQKAMKGIGDINRLCDEACARRMRILRARYTFLYATATVLVYVSEADASVARNQRKSQWFEKRVYFVRSSKWSDRRALLNRSAHRIHDLNERLQQLIKVSTDGRESVASAGSGVEVPQKRGAETRMKTSKSKPSAVIQQEQCRLGKANRCPVQGTGDYLETTTRPQAAARPSSNAHELSKAEPGMSSSQCEVPQLHLTNPGVLKSASELML
ncbi:hypothetical protein AK812_SmicGene35809 [Symbiodinium microadriaticum]|uniref:Uncharacterized protein n=1 Tax=Symbiodinium microadriaticum TaxID=2951 RepID=A0A1Q9CKI8_SYMMI|nr:hypothetical protein AK812_SmicGene35809 [Symbiodinium microadriaticum]